MVDQKIIIARTHSYKISQQFHSFNFHNIQFLKQLPKDSFFTVQFLRKYILSSVLMLHFLCCNITLLFYVVFLDLTDCFPPSYYIFLIPACVLCFILCTETSYHTSNESLHSVNDSLLCTPAMNRCPQLLYTLNMQRSVAPMIPVAIRPYSTAHLTFATVI